MLAGAGPFSFAGRRPIGALVLHGFTSHTGSVRGLAEALAAEGFHVEAPLLPGHGTVVADLMSRRWSHWVAAAEQALDVVARRAERVVLIGQSMGGSLALQLAAARRHVGVVCINPATQPLDASIVDFVRAQLDDGVEVLEGNGSDVADPHAPPCAYSATPLRPLLSMLCDGLPSLAESYPGLDAPLMLITSLNDHVVPPSQSDFLAERYGGTVERVMLTRSFHVATVDYDREMIAERIVAFCDEVGT
jgi:carboxylesterase